MEESKSKSLVLWTEGSKSVTIYNVRVVAYHFETLGD